ncbi:hypothetical protein K420107F6_36770 [Lactonifactor longoviformis]
MVQYADGIPVYYNTDRYLNGCGLFSNYENDIISKLLLGKLSSFTEDGSFLCYNVLYQEAYPSSFSLG